MNIKENWALIRKHFNESFKTSLSVSIATVNKANEPTVTPIGTLFLNPNYALENLLRFEIAAKYTALLLFEV